MYEADNRIQALESEVENAEQRISNLKAETAQYERQAKQCADELQAANDAIENYQELNDELCIKIEKLESAEKTAAKAKSDKASDELAESFAKIKDLKMHVAKLEII